MLVVVIGDAVNLRRAAKFVGAYGIPFLAWEKERKVLLIKSVDFGNRLFLEEKSLFIAKCNFCCKLILEGKTV